MLLLSDFRFVHISNRLFCHATNFLPCKFISLIQLGSQFLFLEPNASDPLNKEAAEDLRVNREGFKRNVRTSMSGGFVKGEAYDRVNK